MVFLPGDHTLDMNITVANVDRLTMRGQSSSDKIATVICSGPVGLSFTSMVEFKMCSLAFTSCSRRLRYATITLYTPVYIYGAMYLQSTQYAELVNCSFHDNNGTALLVNNTNITLAGNTEFTHNRACGKIVLGGAIIAVSSNLTFTGNTTFLGNRAISGQCPIGYYVVGGAAIYTSDTVLSSSGTNNFINNSADNGGGAILALENSVLHFSGTNNFINNSASIDGGAILAYENSVLHFSGTNNFINNSADGGDGVIFLGLKSTLSILPNTTVYWENNHAHFGGAIYAADASPASYCPSVSKFEQKEECFFQLPGQNLSNGIDVQLVFKNNSADAGSVLYGGAIDNCILIGLDSNSSGKVFDKIVHISDADDNATSTISSDPLRICYCENLPDCSDPQLLFPRTVYPGETFQVSVVAVGQRDGTVPSTVISIINQRYYSGHLPDSQHLQQANNTCTKLDYTVLSLSPHVDIELKPEDSPCSVFANTNTKLSILVPLHQNCPPGFSISASEKSCVCEPRLARYTNSCTITNGVGRITRKSGQEFWIGYDDQSQSDDKLILHPLCPYSYCVNHEVTLPLNESDMQCACDRSGLLCGACKEGYSLVLGTSHCRKCPNDYHLALLIPFAVMGLALIFFLLVCKLTVATGMLSGLVFYANIIGPNRTMFLPVESTNAFSIFIAWLNLDFGIETCFYNGMDVYSKTWLCLCSLYIFGC